MALGCGLSLTPFLLLLFLTQLPYGHVFGLSLGSQGRLFPSGPAVCGCRACRSSLPRLLTLLCLTTPMTSSVHRSLPAPLLVDPVTGQALALKGRTIRDVSASDLAGGAECAMVVIKDIETRQALLGIPNQLGWKYHFGISARNGIATKGLATAAVADLAQRGLVDEHAASKTREAGLMLFTFITEPPLQNPPMRVRVFETSSSSSLSSTSALSGPDMPSGRAGWYAYDKVPYDQMWQDDVLWLPQLLDGGEGAGRAGETHETYFEGHFVFGGSPGAATCVLTENCAFA